MKIAIVGYGAEGRANHQYFRAKHPDAEMVLFDEKEIIDAPDDAVVVTGGDAFEQIEGFDLIVRSPGVAPRRIKQADNHWSSTREFMRQCPAPIVGVTGSKGKGTTCSWIAAILNRHFANDADRHIHVVGNIGVPALSKLSEITENDIVVYELSSFQLWDCTQSPHVSVMTMIEPDHLNVHADFSEYLQAKLNIFNYQHDGNVAVYNKNDGELSELIHHIIVTTRADDMPFPSEAGAHFDDDNFYMGDEEICPTGAVKLPGEHNLVNACAAIAATWELIGHDKQAVELGLGDFDGLPHRLKFVRTVNDTSFYDDSIATTPGSAIAAIHAFAQPKILILGGSDKGADYHELGQAIETSNVRAVLAIGANRQKIVDQISEETKVPVVQSVSTSMEEIVQTAYDLANPNDVVIMSPAAASFDMFKSYVDRGQQFVAAVNNLK